MIATQPIENAQLEGLVENIKGQDEHAGGSFYLHAFFLHSKFGSLKKHSVSATPHRALTRTPHL
jgi:hypothetical protein